MQRMGYSGISSTTPRPVDNSKLGKRFDNILNAHDIVLLSVDKRHYREYLGWSRWFYGGDSFPCFQLICPDRANLFPWDDGFYVKFMPEQPDLSDVGWASLGALN